MNENRLKNITFLESSIGINLAIFGTEYYYKIDDINVLCNYKQLFTVIIYSKILKMSLI